MQRSLNEEVPCLIGRRRSADVMVALDEECLAAGLRKERGRGQSAEAPANNDNVVVVSHGL